MKTFPTWKTCKAFITGWIQQKSTNRSTTNNWSLLQCCIKFLTNVHGHYYPVTHFFVFYLQETSSSQSTSHTSFSAEKAHLGCLPPRGPAKFPHERFQCAARFHVIIAIIAAIHFRPKQTIRKRSIEAGVVCFFPEKDSFSIRKKMF